MVAKSLESDEELERILEKIAGRFYRSRRDCCKQIYPVGAEITSYDDFLQALRSCRIVFVNYYSPICPYCEYFNRIYVEVGREYVGRAAFLRVNVMRVPGLALRYNIMMTPTTQCFVDGVLKYTIPGFVPYDRFSRIVGDIIRRAGC